MDNALPEPSSSFDHIEIRNLFDLVRQQDQIEWRPFRDGVEIHRLYGDGVSGPTAALIRFNKSAQIPLHFHDGYEHIIVLAGSQSDQNGRIGTGTLRIHPPRTSHSVLGEEGCIVLAIYEKPVRFLEA